MAQWRIKEMSDLTGVSVRMLHHYDKIGLLNPSVRSANGYRWYGEQDLAILQQIVALKFFGFSLEQIKTMVQQKIDFAVHLRAQQQQLKEQVEQLVQAEQAIGTVLDRLGSSKVPDWNDLISLIERYRMTAELKNSWAKRVLSAEQFEAYMEMYRQHPKEFAAWDNIIEQINNNELGDAEGPGGERAVEALYDLLVKTKDTISKQRHLSADILKSIKAGKISESHLTPDGSVWLSKAGIAYWLRQWEALYADIVENVQADPTGSTGKKIADQWRTLIAKQCLDSSKDLGFGAMIWHEMAKQQHELRQLKTIPTLQEQVNNKVHIPLFFNPDALTWIEMALNSHQ